MSSHLPNTRDENEGKGAVEQGAGRNPTLLSLDRSDTVIRMHF